MSLVGAVARPLVLGLMLFSNAHAVATALLLLSNVFLTGLQFMWGRKVWRKVQRALKGANADHTSASPSRAQKYSAERQSRTSDEHSSSSDDGHDEIVDAQPGCANDMGVQRRAAAGQARGTQD